MDQYAESAAAFADSARAAVAFLRAVRDQRHDDLTVITEGVNPYSLAVQVANVACHNYGITDEFLDQELELLNQADIDGELERFSTEPTPLAKRKPPAEWL